MAPARRAWRRGWLPFGLLGAYLVGYLVWFVASAGSSLRTFISDAAYLPPGVVGVIAGVALVRRRDLTGRTRLAWGFITGAIAFRLFGDTSWWWLEAVREEEPFPSVADVGFVGFPLLFFAGLALLGRGPRSPLRERALEALDVLVVAASAFAAIWFFVLRHLESTDGLPLALNIYYPVTDVVLIGAAARVLMRTGTRSPALLATLTACALFVVADCGFAYLSATGGFVGGEWLDIPWVSACVIFATAVELRRRGPARREDLVGARPPSLLPMVAVIGIGALLVWAVLDASSGLLVTALAVVAVLTMSAFRQVLGSRQYASLAARYRAMATRDALTGVLTRGEGMARADAVLAAAPRAVSALLMLDMDRFKEINDRYGHPAGDAALAAVAERVRSTVQQDDIVCRYGGDEFFVLLPDLDAHQARRVADRIEQSVAADPVRVGTQVLPVAVTVGVAARAGATLPRLMEEADTALRARKTLRRTQRAA